MTTKATTPKKAEVEVKEVEVKELTPEQRRIQELEQALAKANGALENHKAMLELKDRELKGIINVMPEFIECGKQVDPAFFESRLHTNSTLSVLYQLNLLTTEFKEQLLDRFSNFEKSKMVAIKGTKRKFKEDVKKIVYDDENPKPETKAAFIRRLVAAGKSDTEIISEGVVLGVRQRNVTWYRAHP